MDNPFQINYPDQADTELVKMAIDGDKKALENLVARHHIFVYNLALKMTNSVEDAEDLAQEVFIKVITALSKFKGKSEFRTWLYRITVNHFLNTKKSKTELLISNFESYGNFINDLPEKEISDEELDELKESIEELRIRCTAGMLLCLERQQRMVYILGEMFEVDHNLGAEILNISRANFRIRLMRARQDLYNWMNKTCGLVNKSNPCRCAKKTKHFVEAGFVDPKNLKFNTRYRQKIYDLSEKKANVIVETVEDLNKEVFQSHPLQEPLEATKVVDKILSNELIKNILNL